MAKQALSSILFISTEEPTDQTISDQSLTNTQEYDIVKQQNRLYSLIASPDDGRQRLDGSDIILQDTSFPSLVETKWNCSDFSLLHCLVSYDPPIQIVLAILKIFPDQLSACDCFVRTPLHVASHIAAGSNVSADLVYFLTKVHPHTCKIQDKDGKTPLLLACDTSGCDESTQPCMVPSFDVVRALLTQELDAVHLEDNMERRALEFAIISDTPLRVVQLLQLAAQSKYLKQKDETCSLSPRNCKRQKIEMTKSSYI